MLVHDILPPFSSNPKRPSYRGPIVKGSGRGGQQQQQRRALGEEGGLCLASTQMTKKEEKEEKRCLSLPELGCLATYVGYVPCVSVCLD